MATKEKSEVDKQNYVELANKWQEKIALEYTYCMFSTLNQMVNYLPMLMLDFKQPKMYVTLENHPENKNYDDNLKKTCKDLGEENAANKQRFQLPDKEIEIADINEVETIISTLEDNAKNKKVLWNITGGQRPFVMAIFELLKKEERKEDIVMYIEGNAGKLVFMKVDEDKKLISISNLEHGFDSYAIDDRTKEFLTIPIALKLIGIKIQRNYQNAFSEKNELLTINKKYESTSEIFRKRLLSLNKQFKENKTEKHTVGDQEKEITFYDNGIRKWADDERRAYLVDNDDDTCFNEEEYKLLAAGDKPYIKRSSPFGHLLEDMFAQKIWNILQGKVADIAFNVRLFNPDEAVEGTIDELDIVVLSKTGQMVVFEVKSGEMHSDIAKSTKYTTYAISGVYGNPILLTALLKSQLNDLKGLENNWAFGASASAARAAKRAKLPIICLDGDEEGNSFEESIKKLIHL